MKAAALACIRQAFPPAPIRAHGAFAAWGGTYADVADYEAAIDGRPWTALEERFVIRRSDALGFLGTEQLASVLPFYLTQLLELPPESEVAGMLTLILVPSGPGQRRFDALVAALTVAQRAAVATALCTFAAMHPNTFAAQAADAAGAFWRQ